MLVSFPRVDGQPVSIDAGAVLWCRPTLLADEPKNATMIHYSGGGTYSTLYTIDNHAAVRAKLAPHARLATFTNPMDISVSVGATRVNPVLPASPQLDPPSARAALIVGGKRLAVRETPEEARQRINAALASGSA
jgi:hypothetical protein